MKKLIYERTMLKILVERNGILLSVTTRSRAYFFFVSTKYVGLKVGPTTDPYPGIVEMCGYNLVRIVMEWDDLYRYRLNTSKSRLQRTSQQS